MKIELVKKFYQKELEKLKKQIPKAKTVKEMNAIKLKIQFIKKQLEELA